MFDSDNNVIGFYRENGEYGCFSNWYMASFEIGKITYNCVEQYMMFQKAMMFGEFGIAEQVMESNDPSAINKLGHSQMKFFNSNIWDKVSYT